MVHRCGKLQTFGLSFGALHHIFLLSCPQLEGTLKLSTLPTLRLCVARQCSRLTIEVDSRHEKLLQLVVSQIYRLHDQPDAERPHRERPNPGFMPDTRIKLPPSLVKFSYEHTNSLCPAITQPQC